MDHRFEESASADESNSAEKVSTTDDVDSRNWSDEDESRDELDTETRESMEDSDETDSPSEEESDRDDRASTDAGNGYHRTGYKTERRKRAGKKKRVHQSDTETRKLLDDVGDEDDYTYLDEYKENTEVDPQLFNMSEEQLDYYTKCFLHLQRKTQGQASLSGAVSGSDDKVVEFFRKSRLSTKTLSRVWALADINEDGFLNHSEFTLAMHLIVLHVKGNVPVPSRLPSPVRPCFTPVRFLQPVPSELQNSTASSTSGSRGSEPRRQQQSTQNHHTHYFQSRPGQQPSTHLLQATTSYVEDSNPKQHSLSDDHLHVHAQREAVIANFSDAPPVLVDSRPMALNVKTTSAGFALLNSLSSRGPPPRPPARQYNTSDGKGHRRNASLDLNTLTAVAGQFQKYNPTMYQSTTQSAYANPTTMSVDESMSASAFTSSAHFFDSQTFPTPPTRRTPELHSKSTQTDIDCVQRQPSIDENTFAALLEGVQQMPPAERCRVLRLYNAELEKEKATLAQVRLQLITRLEEIEQALKNYGINVEPIADQISTQPRVTSISSPKPTTV